jgi:radical SAM superfamily enzyme YgiQ (UPF0313 family)
MTGQAGNVVRDVLYGCWCKGKRIGGGTVPPFNHLVLAALLRQEGFSADFLDAQAEQIPPDRVADRMSEYDFVVISTSTMSFIEDANYLSRLKEKNPGLKTAVFGSHPTFLPEYCLAHQGVDICIRHEPEFILRDLVRLMAAGEDWTAVQGIAWRNSGRAVINEKYPLIENLDELPFPDVSLLPPDIHYFNPLVRRTPYITSTTSKGCPANCIFCTAPAFDGHTYRHQSAERVLNQLEYFASQGIREVYFRDDTFFVIRKRDQAICRGIIDRGLDLTWLANARVSLIDSETMALAHKAGCHTIKFGIESGSQEILDEMRKGYRIERAHEVFAWARDMGMRTHAHVMLGNPGETRETVEKTIEYVLALAPTTATFGICTPYPGTPLYERVRAIHPEIGDGTASDLSRLHVTGLFNEHYTSLKRHELEGLVRRAYRRFYLRPGYWLQAVGEQVRGMDDIKRLSIAAVNVLDFILRGKD